MKEYKPIHTPMTEKFKAVLETTTLCDPHEYRLLVEVLQYLNLTRPDISFSVNYASLFMHDPTQDHLTMVKRILCYVKGTINHGLHIQQCSSL